MAGINGPSVEAILKSIDSKVSDGYNRLHIMLNTPGGSVAHGLVLHKVLKSIPIEIYTYNIGSVDSIGVVIFCSGYKRYSVPNARFLIHLGAEIISIPESSANPPQQQQGIVLPGGIQIGYSQNYTSIFDNGIGFSSSLPLK